MSLSITIPGLPSCNSAAAVHWRVRHKERLTWKANVKHAVLEALGRFPAEPFKRARVECTRCSTTEPDADNLASSWKFILDGLVEAGVIQDDKPSCIDFVSRWERAPRGAGCVRINVGPVDTESGVEIGPRVMSSPWLDGTGGEP